MTRTVALPALQGEYRVRNVRIGDAPLDPDAVYTAAGNDFTLLNHGDGFTMFDGAPVLTEIIKLDNQVLIDSIRDTLGGIIGEAYEDPYEEGRITIVEAAQ